MKFRNLILPALFAAALCSCSDDSDSDWLVTFNDVTAFTGDYWEYCYEKSKENSLTFYNFDKSVNFSHSCDATEWDGVTYYSWDGFTPSRSTDTKDYTGGDWIQHQWCAAPGKGMEGSKVYMVACCDANETADDALTSTTAVITSVSAGKFKPRYAYITNTTYGLYGMMNGTAFSRAFTKDDWCKVTATGVANGVKTGSVDFYLAKDNEFVTKWTAVDLSPLNECEKVVFTMESSDSGEWGMNSPAYFALGAFVWGY